MEKWKSALLGCCLVLCSCAQVNHNVEGNVDVNVGIDFSELEKYFKPVCEQEIPSGTDEQIDDCVNLKIGLFLQGVDLSQLINQG